MNSFAIADLKAGSFFTADAMLDDNFILLNGLTPLTDGLLKALKDWSFTQVFSSGKITGAGIEAAQKTENTTAINQNTAAKSAAAVSEKTKLSIEAAEEKNEDIAAMEDVRLQAVKKGYREYENYINQIYTRFATHKELNQQEIANVVKDMCTFIKENKRYVLRLSPWLNSKNKDFLTSHSMCSTVFALTIGLQLRLPPAKLIELGIACIVHELGMIRLPPQLYMSENPLSLAQKKAIHTHPILTYNILKEYGFPLSICLAVLEHHEREDGSGYPRKLDGDKISMYAKIISVACSVAAITAPRRYKEAQTIYTAMVEMLKNMGNQYDERIIKALLYSISLFPIGSYVHLEGGKIGLIVDTNSLDPKNPFVQILNETEENGKPKIVETGEYGVKIIRVLTQEETVDVVASLKKAAQAK
jgi:HD domain protein